MSNVIGLDGRRKDRFVQVPISLVEHQISAEALRLWMLLQSYCYDDKTCWPSTDTLAKRLRKSKKRIFAYLSELERSHLIGRNKRSGISSEYQVFAEPTSPENETQLVPKMGLVEGDRSQKRDSTSPKNETQLVPKMGPKVEQKNKNKLIRGEEVHTSEYVQEQTPSPSTPLYEILDWIPKTQEEVKGRVQAQVGSRIEVYHQDYPDVPVASEYTTFLNFQVNGNDKKRGPNPNNVTDFDLEFRAWLERRRNWDRNEGANPKPTGSGSPRNAKSTEGSPDIHPHIKRLMKDVPEIEGEHQVLGVDKIVNDYALQLMKTAKSKPEAMPRAYEDVIAGCHEFIRKQISSKPP